MSQEIRPPSPPSRAASADPGSGLNPVRSYSHPKDTRSCSRERSGSYNSSSKQHSNRSRSGSPRSRSRSLVRPVKVWGDRENPHPSTCLGVFHLNFATTEKDLEFEFGKFGKIEKVNVVVDGPSRRSRGFAFIYFENVADAEKARDAMNGAKIDGFTIRVVFSITNSAHRPTPGVYFHHGKAMKPGFRGRREGYGRDDYRGRSSYKDRDHDSRNDRKYEHSPPPVRGYHDRGYDHRNRNDHRESKFRLNQHRDYNFRDKDIRFRDERSSSYYDRRFRDDRLKDEDKYRNGKDQRSSKDYYDRYYDRSYDEYSSRYHERRSHRSPSFEPPSHRRRVY